MRTIKHLLSFLLIMAIAFAVSFFVGYIVLCISGSTNAAWSIHLFGGLGLTLILTGMD